MQGRRPHGLVLLSALSAFAVANARQVAPRFTATTLTGETFSNDSLKGQVVLLQFWTTWCPHCREEEPILESITRDFSDKGLVVLAVDVHEPAQTVRQYLAEHPRSCHIVLTQNTDLVAEFAPHGIPLYVLIDRDGNIAGTQVGGGGEEVLRQLLTRAGLGESSMNSPHGSDQPSPAPKTTDSSSAKLIEVPRGQNVAAARPLPPTVFVLKNGERLESHHYTIREGSLRIAEHGQMRSIPLAAVDLKATIASNHERGIELRIPTNQSEILLGF